MCIAERRLAQIEVQNQQQPQSPEVLRKSPVVNVNEYNDARRMDSLEENNPCSSHHVQQIKQVFPTLLIKFIITNDFFF